MEEKVNAWFGSYKTYSFDHFLPQLIKEKSVIERLSEHFGANIDHILKELASGSKLSDEGEEAYDIIYQVMWEEEEVVESIMAYGTDEFSIDIYNFGPLYYVRAVEFDEEGFFLKQEDAEDWARDNYESYIMAYEEYAEEHGIED